MTRSPDDQIDPYESRLSRRVADFTDQAVRPIDAAAIAAAAHAGARRRTLGGRLFGSTSSMARLGVVLAGALVAVAAFGIFNAGGHGVPAPSASSGGSVATPTSLPGGLAACAARDLAGVITAWEGAAGHRIATVDLHNGGAADCLLPRYLRTALIDGTGRALIVADGVAQPSPITFPAGAYATTMVDMANYCSSAPSSPLRIRLYLEDASSVEVSAAAALSDQLDPPPCNGPNAAAEIQMQELHLK
jgi:uncharacterized protein DUF4232